MATKPIVIAAGVLAFAFLLTIYSAWGILEPWEIGLDYSMITQRIAEDPWGPGRHYIGVGHSFLRFNSTVTTVQFSHDLENSAAGPLKSRTADGLEVALELSFQYVLIPDQLYKMYSFYGPDFHNVFVKMSMDLLTVAATKHIAQAYFVNRTNIGNMMEETLKTHFRERAFVDVPLFQFQAVSLPQEFEDAIKKTQVAEQQIKRVSAEQSMNLVEYQTGVLQAQRYVSVRQQQAEAVAQSIMLKNSADVASFNATQLLAADAFQHILSLFQGDADRLLEYMKVRAMRDHPAQNSIVGISDALDAAAKPHLDV
eukprot:TRINITY_DN125524_c0_g1_i1.p1 TRINITY_DN125524_c0_g1~~TRINITY_DN125524_c0_g1_i1.p1  ORF type:complete len:312 (-),score=69.66 TRINITY_DN125524_c0_g1_i1:68-1003(-)